MALAHVSALPRLCSAPVASTPQRGSGAGCRFPRPADQAIPQRLGRVRSELARNPYQGSPQATELDEQIEDFTRETIVRDLHDLPAGSD